MYPGGGGVTALIRDGWRAPRTAFRDTLEARPPEGRVLAYALLAALVGFVAGIPSALEQAQGAGADVGRAGILTARLFGAVFLMPLALYALAAISHLVARPFGGRAGFYGARLALVWAVVVAIPLVVANGVLAALGPGWLGLPLAAAFLWFWSAALAEAEGFRRTVFVFVTILALAFAVSLIPQLLNA